MCLLCDTLTILAGYYKEKILYSRSWKTGRINMPRAIDWCSSYSVNTAAHVISKRNLAWLMLCNPDVSRGEGKTIHCCEGGKARGRNRLTGDSYGVGMIVFTTSTKTSQGEKLWLSRELRTAQIKHTSVAQFDYSIGLSSFSQVSVSLWSLLQQRLQKGSGVLCIR